MSAPLVSLAQRWLDLAELEFSRRRFGNMLSEFNEQQMRPQKEESAGAAVIPSLHA